MITQLEFSSLKPSQRKRFDLLITESLADPFVGGEWLKDLIEKVKTNSLRKNKKEQFFILEKDSEYIGFYCPRLEGGYWRSGTIYLAKKHRGKGYMSSILKTFFSNHTPAAAWISNSNENSKKLYTKLGFTKGKDYNLSAAPIDNGSWYYLNKPIGISTESIPTWITW